MNKFFSGSMLWLLPFFVSAQNEKNSASFIRDHYSKREVTIPMRDGVKLFTAIYEPKDTSQVYPILMERTPYSCFPYGENQFPSRLAPNPSLMREGYIIVYQDVRGRYKSEGNFKEMTPAMDHEINKEAVDESTDSYDTIEWLLRHTRNNGKVGIWGISYPGFYASASLPDAHPAIKAVSPQAPVTDEFIGDDCNHNGAFFLLDNFGFYNYFDGTRNENGENYKPVFKISGNDSYRLFKEIGTLKKANGPGYFNQRDGIWNQVLQHDIYDSFWQARNIRPHLKNIRPATLLVGGWFDAEDLFGALRSYEAIEKQSSGNENRLLMGPWTHGAWANTRWEGFGSHRFGKNLNEFYQDIETRFFNHYLKNKDSFDLPEATVYETGTNRWKQYDQWPPANSRPANYYFSSKGKLTTELPGKKVPPDNYESDPANPVPYTAVKSGERNNEYMVEDQRFVSGRPDVLVYQTDLLDEDLTLTGRIHAQLYVSGTGTDADFVVKLIDVLPDDEPDPVPNPRHFHMAGFQRLVRAEVFRGKFRRSYEKPVPFVPGNIESMDFDLNEVAHVFKKGHRIMVQVQSSWFPLVDRNPQQFMKIPEATESDFRKATIRLYHDSEHPSHLTLPVLQE